MAVHQKQETRPIRATAGRQLPVRAYEEDGDRMVNVGHSDSVNRKMAWEYYNSQLQQCSSYVQYWAKRWWNHPLNRGRKEDLSLLEVNPEVEEKFDWQFFVEKKDVVLSILTKYKKKRLPSANPPKKSRMKEITVKGRKFTIVDPYDSYFDDEHQDPSELIHEGYSMSHYDERTHFKFSRGNYEAILRAARQIWRPRCHFKKAKMNWRYVISPCVYDILADIQREFTGYNEEWFGEFNAIKKDPAKKWSYPEVENTEENGDEVKETVVEDVDSSPVLKDPGQEEEPMQIDEHFTNDLGEPWEKEVHDKFYDEATPEEFIAIPEEYRPKLEVINEDDCDELHEVKENEWKKVLTKPERVCFRYFPRIEKENPDYPIKHSFDCQNLMEYLCKPIFTPEMLKRTYFEDLPEVFKKIGRPDLSLTCCAPVRAYWRRKKQLCTNIRRRWEIQSGTPTESADRCDPHSARNRLQRCLMNILPLLDRHEERCMVMSHRGRFRYLTTWDMSLWMNIERKISHIDLSLWEYLKAEYMLTTGVEQTASQMPRTYVENARWVRRLVLIAVQSRRPESIICAFKALEEFKEYWRNIRFDERLTRCVWEAQSGGSDSTSPPLKSAGGSGGSVAAGTTDSVKLDTPIKSGDKTVSITMVDQREKDTASIPKAKTAVKEKDSAKEQLYQMLDFAKRWQMIDRLTWDTTQDTGKEVKSWVLPSAYFSAASTKVVCQNLNAAFILAQFGLSHFDMRVKIQINSVKFQQGRLLCVFKPFYAADREYDVFNNYTQYPYVMIDASTSNTAEMDIAWTNFRALFPHYVDPNQEYNYFGTFHVYVWNKLQTGANSSTNTSITVWMQLNNLVVHQLCNPKNPGTLTFATQIRQLPKVNKIKKDQVNLNTAITLPSSTREWHPQAGLIEGVVSTATGLVEEMGVNLVEQLLTKVARGSNSKPNGVLPPQLVTPKLASNSAPGVGIDMSNRMALTIPSACTPDKNQFAQQNMSDLIKEWSRVGMFTWDASHTANTSLVLLPVTPLQRAVTGVGKLTPDMDYEGLSVQGDDCDRTTRTVKFIAWKRNGCMLDYLSRPFRYWRGDLNWKFEVVCTNMHSGRLFIRYEPCGTGSTAKLECQKLACPGVVWDVMEEHTLELTTPYMAPQPFLQTDYIVETGIHDQMNTRVSCGILEVTVMNPLKVTTGISSNVTINVYLSAGPGFEFAVLGPLDGLIGVGESKEELQSTNRVTNDVALFWSRMARYLRAPCSGLWAGTKEYTAKDKTKWRIADNDVNGVAWAEGPFVTKSASSGKDLLGIDDWYEAVYECLNIFSGMPQLTNMGVGLQYDTFEEAYQYLKTIPKSWPDEITSLAKADGVVLSDLAWEKFVQWCAIVLMAGSAIKVTHLPRLTSDAGTPLIGNPVQSGVTKRVWEMQAAKVSGGQGINPFKEFVPSSNETESLFGESFMDIYKIMKRWNYWTQVEIGPTINPGANDALELKDYWQPMLAALGTMSSRERNNYWFELKIPVTPMTQFSPIGSQDTALQTAWDKKFSVIGSEVLFKGDQSGGYDVYSHSNITMSRFFSELFTFWRGSLRYRFMMSRTKDQNGQPWSFWVCHNPRGFVPNSGFRTKISLQHSKRLGDLFKLGMEYVSGNVASTVDIEVPYYSKYQRLYCSDQLFDDTTNNGCLHILVPVRGNWKTWCPTAPPDFANFSLFGMPLKIFTAVGEDFEFSVKRPAPVQYLHNDFYNFQPTPNSFPKGFDKLGGMGDARLETDANSTWHPDSVRQHIEVNELNTEITTVNNIKSATKLMVTTGNYSYTYKPRKLANYDLTLNLVNRWNWHTWSFTDYTPKAACKDCKEGLKEACNVLTTEEKEKSKIYSLEEYVKPSHRNWEVQGGDGDEESEKDVQPGPSTVTPEETKDDVDSVFSSLVMSVKELPGVIKDFSSTVAAANSAVQDIRGSVQIFAEAVTTVKDGTTKITDSVTETASRTGKIVSYSFNAVRMGIFLKGVLDVIKAEDWSERWVPIASCALALGLTTDVVTSAGEWLFSQATGLFGSPKVHEGLKTQAWEDRWDKSWTAFVEEHAQLFQFVAAGAFTILTFYMTSSSPLAKNVTSFASQMLTKLRNFTFVGMAFKTADWMFRWIADVIKTAVITVADFCSGGMVTAYRMSSHYPEVIAWLQKVEKYEVESIKSELAWNHDARIDMWKLMDQGDELIKKLTSRSGSMYNTLSRGMCKLSKVDHEVSQVRNIVPFREDPFHICLVGEPGCQKSAVLTHILNFACDQIGYPKRNRIYSRAEESDFWTGYNGHIVTMIDDLAQDKKGKAVKELIKMKSNLAWQLNMADLTEKGRCFMSKMIGSTSNLAFPEPVDMEKPPAMWRRRDMLVRVSRNKIQGVPPKSDFSDMSFELLEPTGQNGVGVERVIKGPITMVELLVITTEMFRDWIATQRNLVYSALQGRTIEYYDYDDGAPAIPETVDCIEAFLKMVKSGARLTDTYLSTSIKQLNQEGWNRVLADVIAVSYLVKMPLFVSLKKEYDHEREADAAFNRVGDSIPNQRIARLMQLVDQGDVILQQVEGKDVYRRSINGVVQMHKGQYYADTVEDDEGNTTVIARWVPQGIFDEYDIELGHALIDAEKAELLRQAQHCVEARSKLLEGCGVTLENLRPVRRKKRCTLADDKEIESFVSHSFVNETQEDQKKIQEDLKALFNKVHGVANSSLFQQKDELAVSYGKLFKEEFNKYWKSKENPNDKSKQDWYMELPEATDEESMSNLTLYELMVEDWGQERINERKQVIPVKFVQPAWITRFIKYLEQKKCDISKWFEDHPHITTVIKTAIGVAAIFGGYKIVSTFFPSWVSKIKAAIMALFGWGVSKVGEERVEKVKQVGIRVATATKDKFVQMKDYVRSFLSGSDDHELREMASDEEIVTLFAESLPSALKTSKPTVMLRLEGSRPSNKRTHLNAYMLGQDRLHVESESQKKEAKGDLKAELKGIKKQLAEYAVKARVWEDQGTQDPNAQNIRTDLLMKNMVRLTWAVPGKSMVLNGLFLGGRTLLCPYHFWSSCEEGQIFCMQLPNTKIEFYDTFDPKKCAKVANQDLSVYECSVRVGQFKQVLKHIPSANEVTYDKTSATLNVISGVDLGLIVHMTEANMIRDVEYVGEDGEKFENAIAWDYNINTTKGDCGAILLANNSGVRCKIIGMHVSGAPRDCYGASAILIRESIEDAMKLISPVSQVLPTPLEIQCLCTKSVDAMSIQPQGNFHHFGAVHASKAVKLPHKTEIQPSVIHDMVRAHVTEPSVLTMNDPRLEVPGSPLRRAIEKYGKPTRPFPQKDMDYVFATLAADISKWRAPMGKRLLTDHEAVFGNELIEFCDRMNLSASPGYPYTLSRPSGEKGKAYLFDVNAEDGIACENYRREYRVRELLAQSGIRKISIWTDCLKDERRPMAKIYAGKTRAFMLPPADYVQLCRKYFMAFNVTFYCSAPFSFSAVGVDPYGFHWTQIARKLRKNSNLAFAGDFHSFDGILDPEIIWQIGLLINAWYKKNNPNWKPEDDKVRMTLVEEMIHTIHICRDSLYQKHQGNPSGNPLTVILNTIAHNAYLKVAWLGLSREHCIEMLSLYFFFKCVAEMYYGDDGIYTVKKDVSQWFNCKTVSAYLARFGIEYTDEAKSGELYGVRPMTECTFLKNGFTRLEDTNLWLAPISKDTIYELTNWVRKSDDPISQLRENLEDVFNFAFFHGRDFFDSMLNDVNQALEKKGLKPEVQSYDHHKEQFLAKCRG